MNKLEDWLTVGVIGFLAGIVTNLIVPARRGLWGFLAAAVIGLFCGGMSGIIAGAFEASYGIQYLLAAVFGLCGNQTLTALLNRQATTVNIHGGNNQNFMGNNAEGRQNVNE